jgi:PPOX class probable F420-dependent enzyme
VRHFTPDDLADFLEEPIVAVLATHWADGSVLLSPVWHEWRDGGFTVATTAGDVKVRHLRRDPHASILVAEIEPPYRGIEVRCRAALSPDPGGDTTIRLAIRYLGEARGRAYAETLGDDTLIRLEPDGPDQVRAWDFSDDFPADPG